MKERLRHRPRTKERGIVISSQDIRPGTEIPQNIRSAWAFFLRWRRKPIAATDHEAVIEHVCAEGDISARYAVMVVLSCGIAILGLLLSSPAVIIGAMLISPLMGPIMQFGFSLAVLDYAMARRGLKALALGTALAVAQAALIVWLSPLNAVTSEILARTRPNFFDLMVAVLSAVAGAYAVIKQKGETIVGVAIATALMPPLAVVGYGLATRNWAIFGGAFGLFLTNMLAISLTACLVAKFFGFGAHRDTKTSIWQTVAIVGIFMALSVPLGLSLRQLANEAWLTTQARKTLADIFPAPQNHLYGVNVAFPDDHIEVSALVLTRQMRPGLEDKAQGELSKRLNRPVSLSLSQTPADAREFLDRQAAEEMMNQSSARIARQTQPDMVQIAASETGVERLYVSQDPATHSVLVRPDAVDAQRLLQLRAAQERLAHQYPDWRFVIRPELDALPPIAFEGRSDALDDNAAQLTGTIAWVLKTNGVTKVDVIGYSDSGGTRAANQRSAAARAAAVAQMLEAEGLVTQRSTGFPAPDQRAVEREHGLISFRKVRIAPMAD